MKRNIGDTATDPQTGFVWICVHTDAHYGPHWATYHPTRGTRTSDEPEAGPPAAEGLARALAAGVTPAGGLALAPYKRLAEAAQDELRWHDETSHKELKAALDGLPEE